MCTKLPPTASEVQTHHDPDDHPGLAGLLGAAYLTSFCPNIPASSGQRHFNVADKTENGSSVYSKIEAALFDLGRFSEVEKFYQRALNNNPENLDALAKIANVLEEKGERQKALELVEEALSKHDDSIKLRLMKLKLSIQHSSPPQLSQQIDRMIDIMSSHKQ